MAGQSYASGNRNRARARDAQSINILAGKAVAKAVRTTLGPKGMDKMLVDGLGDIVITNDGATILKEMDIEHPAAKMVVEVSKAQDDEVGDGTTTAAVLTGELLTKAEELIEKGVHPTIISGGYRHAAEKAVDILKTITIDVSPDDRETLSKLAKTALTGKAAGEYKDFLADIAIDAVLSVVEETDEGIKVDVDDITIEKRDGGSILESELVKGLVIDKERVRPNMPRKIENAKVLLASFAIEFQKIEKSAEIKITSPDQMNLFVEQEEKMVKEMVDKIIASGANVVFCQKGIDDLAQYYLEKAGVYACRRITKSDLKKLARATGATLFQDVTDIRPEDLGEAEVVEERELHGSKMTFLLGCKEAKTASLILHGGTTHIVDSLKRALNDALCVIGVALEDKKIVVGGGSTEIELALRLREYAATLKGREQLAVAKFAEALEIIPQTLAENAGLDPIDKLIDLRAQHEEGNKNMGLDVYTGKVVDMYENDILEPLRIKTQAINAATEATVMILRIDDVVAASGKGGAMPPGMPQPDMDM
ncbi:thermosome subunit alpha [Methanolobus vulcani]|uniref:Thermosome subunit n=1 Tax=Methanolobus vulcani TaxID=38026 RepID=A0A7Z8KPR1_9EURY|nr:thermosome subunit alpha [Methanolobus vulcani]TQD26747.1 thermosome subunit [Methanolobus vulcani]